MRLLKLTPVKTQEQEDYCQLGGCYTGWPECGLYRCDDILWGDTIWCFGNAYGYCDAPYPPGGSGLCPLHIIVSGSIVGLLHGLGVIGNTVV